MRLRKWVRRAFGLGLLVAVIAFLVFRPDRLARVAAGVAAHTLCAARFVSGQDPERIFEQQVSTVLGGAARVVRYEVLPKEQAVRASLLGVFRASAHYDEGFGCRIDHPDNRPLPKSSTAEAARQPIALVVPSPAMRAALDEVFREHAGRPPKHVQAVVVTQDGTIVAERYAVGVGPRTRLLSYSVAKSTVNALLGIMVRKGALTVRQPVGAPEWKRGDARARITIEDLMRMQSGLDADETGEGTDPSSQMEFLASDMAAFAANRPAKSRPGLAWDYTSANTLLLVRKMQSALGADAAEFRAFAERELFAPLGMQDVVMEFDGAGHFVGSAYLYATARDYAKLGELFLDDGIAPDGRRLLPEGWVAWSRRSTLGSSYGAGWWTNDGTDDWTRSRIAAGFPKDGFFASGYLGQRIYVIPSEHLVITRFGYSAPPDFGMPDDLAFIAAAIKALHREKGVTEDRGQSTGSEVELSESV